MTMLHVSYRLSDWYLHGLTFIYSSCISTMLDSKYVLFCSFCLMYCNAQVMYDLFYSKSGSRKSIFNIDCSFPCNELGSTMVTFDLMLDSTAPCPDLSNANLKNISVVAFLTDDNPCEKETKACSYCLNKRKKSMILKKSCQVGLSKHCGSTSMIDDASCYDCQLFNENKDVENDL